MTQTTVPKPAPIKLDKWKLFDLIGYEVFDKNVRDFHNSEAKIKVCCAPRRTTKSYSAAHDVIDTLLIPDTRVWVVGPSYTLAEKEFRYIHDVLVLQRDKLGLPKPLVCLTNPRSGQLYIKFAWGSILEGKTADRPESLLGEAVDRVIYSEAAQLSRGIHERYVAPTLITKKGTAIVPTTPDQGAEWVHELFMLGQEGRFPEVDSFSWGIKANPTYDVEEFEKAKKLHGEDSPVFREQYLGEWVFYGGLVYPMYDENLHVIEPFDIPASWPRIRAIDFGHRDPFVTLWGAVGPHGEVYIYREYYDREGAPLPKQAIMIKEHSVGEHITQTVGDPSAAQGIEDLCYHGIGCVSANNDRLAGRLRVSEYLMPTPDGIPPFPIQDLPAIHSRAKWPRMYIFNTCKETTREMRYFRWKEGKKVEGEKERTEGEDHAMDTLRYMMMTRPSPFKEHLKTPSNSFKGWLNKVRNQRAKAEHVGMR